MDLIDEEDPTYKGVHGKARRRVTLSDDKSNLCADCAAAMTITESLPNTTDGVEKSFLVDMAYSWTSKPFVSEPADLFLLKIEQMVML